MNKYDTKLENLQKKRKNGFIHDNDVAICACVYVNDMVICVCVCTLSLFCTFSHLKRECFILVWPIGEYTCQCLNITINFYFLIFFYKNYASFISNIFTIGMCGELPKLYSAFWTIFVLLDVLIILMQKKVVMVRNWLCFLSISKLI